MNYKNPNVESSYNKNNIGHTLYNLVLELKPKKIIEFGTLNGYSAISMAMALHEIGEGGKIICYDLWDSYPYKHSTIEKTKSFINEFSLLDFIELKQMNINDWVVEDFDLLHLDISNDGKTVTDVFNRVKSKIEIGSTMIFEGGTEERDNIEWMLKYNKTPINSIKKEINYIVLNEDFPSISQILL